ncbi:CYFA0S23e00573g1_1 [Cyberlindnera fabianii]|uniref:CYFA0S23e00573g1_1 n=1 Tax=Cyberlindnera fabianii TaxID=36022 RepID=A0A061B8Z4_CYBFA|nr:CYFA0S23e00573g1_1 [Cyberlindnera fabianii]
MTSIIPPFADSTFTTVPNPRKKAISKRFSMSFNTPKSHHTTPTTTTNTPLTTIDAEVVMTSQPKGKVQTSKLKLFVSMIKEGPANTVQHNSSDSEQQNDDLETDAPMPRKKTSYEKFLKHQVREAQVKKYNEMLEKESQDILKKAEKSTNSSGGGFLRLRRNRSGDILTDTDDTPCKKVRFLET